MIAQGLNNLVNYKSFGGGGSGCQWVTVKSLAASKSNSPSIQGAILQVSYLGVNLLTFQTNTGTLSNGICSLHLIHLLISHHPAKRFPRHAKE